MGNIPKPPIFEQGKTCPTQLLPERYLIAFSRKKETRGKWPTKHINHVFSKSIERMRRVDEANKCKPQDYPKMCTPTPKVA